MKLKYPLVAAFVVMLGLSGCGGGGSSSGDTASHSCTITVDPSLKITDNTVGTGATAICGSSVLVDYTGWVYDASKADHKGAQFDSGTGFAVVLGSGRVIPGFEQAIYNMKVGGTRTVEIPAKLAYGSQAVGTIPANSDLVFQLKLTAVK